MLQWKEDSNDSFENRRRWGEMLAESNVSLRYLFVVYQLIVFEFMCLKLINKRT